MKNVGNLKSLYLKWRWSFSLEVFEKVMLGLSSLYHIQMKSPKTVYLTEQCQVHSVRSGTKRSKNVKSLEYIFDSVLCYAFEVETCPYNILSFYRLNAI